MAGFESKAEREERRKREEELEEAEREGSVFGRRRNVERLLRREFPVTATGEVEMNRRLAGRLLGQKIFDPTDLELERRLPTECKCTTKCTPAGNKDVDSWCFVDSKCSQYGVETGVRGKWRYCDPAREPYQMSRTELAQYWLKKAPELLENLRPLNRRMISLGHRAQSEKKNGRKKSLQLADVRLYHPIRGPGERAPAIASLESRKKALLEAVKAGIIGYDTKTHETMVEGIRRPLTQQDLDKHVPEMRSKDQIQVVEVKVSVGVPIFCSSDVMTCPSKIPEVQYLCVSGQGRFLAMKEVFVDELKWIHFRVELEVFDLETALCREMIDVHNEYIRSQLLLGEYGFQAHSCELSESSEGKTERKARPPYTTLSSRSKKSAETRQLTIVDIKRQLRAYGARQTGTRTDLLRRLRYHQRK